jgi:hypothetical protein
LLKITGLLPTEAVQILPLDQIKKTEKESEVPEDVMLYIVLK